MSEWGDLGRKSNRGPLKAVYNLIVGWLVGSQKNSSLYLNNYRSRTFSEAFTYFLIAQCFQFIPHGSQN